MPYEKPPDRIEGLFLQHGSELRRLFRSFLMSEADIDDCIQQTFLRLWQQEERGTLLGDVTGYLFTIAMNVARDLWRHDRTSKKNKHEPLSHDVDSQRSIENEKTLFEREAIRLLEVQLGYLKPTTRSIFLMYHVQSLSVAEIARALGVSTRTIDRELAKALDHCRVALGPTLKDLLS